MKPTIDGLKNKRLLWQASQVGAAQKTLPSGFEVLDKHLQGGLPEQGVVDVSTAIGIGELRLLLPSFVLRQQSSERLLVFIAPPVHLNGPMLLKLGFDLSRILIIEPQNAKDALWSAEQCLKSGCCDGLFLWQQSLAIHQAKRLQFAAETGGALSIIVRQKTNEHFSLPVSLTMNFTAAPEGINVTVTKRKGGSHSEPFVVNMVKVWPELTHRLSTENVLPLATIRSMTG